MSTLERYMELVKLVNYHNKRYHEDDNPNISNYDFDMLKKELKKIEAEHPDWIIAESPTKHVGGNVKRKAGVTVTHNVPMLSIQDVFSKEEVCSWVRIVKKKYPDANFSVEHKIDGLSMTLRYKRALQLAETRGDGFVGEDVTLNAKVIPDVLQEIAIGLDNEAYLELRGEAYMSHVDFEKYNELQEELGKKLAANPRNLAAGTLRQLDPEITKERGLNFFIFNVQDGPDEFKANHTIGLDLLASKGVKVVPHKLCTTEDEILTEIDRIGECRGEFEYDIDGAVIKIEQTNYRRDFPTGSSYSAGHIAYKYPPEEKETQITDIIEDVGRTGKITTKAKLTPVRLCGTTVQYVTLHNQNYISEKGIGIGAKVILFKSGEIIPKIQRVTVAPKTIYQISSTCPTCGQPTFREADTADIKCVNPSCPAQLVRTVSYFASRDAMDIKAFGKVCIQELVDEGYIHSYADIYKLYEYRDELVEKGIMGKDKNTDKILAAIEASKTNDSIKVLTGLGILNVGKSTSKELMRNYDSIRELSKASFEDLITIQDVGEIIAECIVNFFNNPVNKKIIESLSEAGVNMKNKAIKDATIKLEGKTFCITGTLPSLGRKDIEALIEKNGGKITGVSKGLDYLIYGDDAGSKLKKAKSYGIVLLTETDFLNMI